VVYTSRYRPAEHIGYDGIVLYEHGAQQDQGRTTYMGRVIGLPGDRIRIEKGDVQRNGQPVTQTYVPPGSRSDETTEEIVVPTGTFYVLADNRRTGARGDSRGLGPIRMHAVVGEVRP
jgi:signal peptidase I